MTEYHPKDILDLSRGLKEFNNSALAYAVETDEDVVITNQSFLVALPGDQITMTAYNSRYYNALLKRSASSEARLRVLLGDNKDKTWDELVLGFEGKFRDVKQVEREGWELESPDDFRVYRTARSKTRIYYLERNFALMHRVFGELDFQVYWPSDKAMEIRVAGFFDKNGRLVGVFTNSLEWQLRPGALEEKLDEETETKECAEAEDTREVPKARLTVRHRPRRGDTQVQDQP